ncbi:uncharacterized protein LOC122967334 [Thunnus albacares]|uniref:uncharacterized protein LOC122967334 n=1 Tax=Thunnus albacares TaxID=8236 RepID=UPI001CF67979|nr:uncharacterized protein LOC122967334 [Thunnus albacares]
MSAEDQLYELIISWLDQREDFSRHLRELANDLESVNEKCNAGRMVGNSVTVLGGITMIGAGVATFLSAGAAAPLLGLAGAYTAVGSTVTLTSKLIEWWLERGTLEKAKKVSEDNKKLGEKIQRRIKEQIEEIRNSSDICATDNDVIECILRAIAKRNGIPWMEVIGVAKNLAPYIQNLMISIGVIQASQGGFNLETFIRDQAAGFARQTTIDALIVAGKGAVRVGGGIFTVALTLPNTIDNYKRAIEKNNVTGPSEELKKAADVLKTSTQNFREALNEIERKMREMRRSRGWF